MDKVLTPSVGTKIKLNVHADVGSGLHLSDVEFECMFSTNNARHRFLTVKKSEMVKVDNDNYIAVVDTATVGAGGYMMKFSAYVPDGDCEGGYRLEVVRVDTGIPVKP